MLADRFDEPLRDRSGVTHDDAARGIVVRRYTGFFQNRRRAVAERYCLGVFIGLRYEMPDITRCCESRRRRSAGNVNRIERNRGHRHDRMVDLDRTALAFELTQPRCEHESFGTGFRKRAFHRRNVARRRACGDDDGDLATGAISRNAGRRIEQAQQWRGRSRFAVRFRGGLSVRARALGSGQSDILSHHAREFGIDIGEHRSEDALANLDAIYFRQLEREGRNDVLFLRSRHAVPEHRRLREVVAERRRSYAAHDSVDAIRQRCEAAGLDVLRRWEIAIEAIGRVRRIARIDGHPVHAVALAVAERTDRAVDRNFVEVGAAEPRYLRIEVRKVTAL